MYDILKLILQNYAPAILKPEVVETDGNAQVRRTVAIRDGYKLAEIEPARAARPSRAHVFADVQSFASFVLKHYPDGSVVEILADTTEIVAIDAARWEADRVSCVLTRDPDLVAWERAFNTPMRQRVAVQTLQRLSSTLGNEGLLMALQNLDISGTTDRTSKINDNGVIEVRGARQTTTMSAKLPATFTVNVPIYLDGAAVRITVGLQIDAEPAEPTIMFVPRDLELAKLAAYRGEVERLRALLGDAYLVGAGKLVIES